MATPQDLERLRALLGQLTQIGNARRGELIRAEDWNTLVLTLADVARAVLATDATAAVPAHEHPDQVSNGWLTPALRDLLERGPLADPATQQRLTGIEQSLRRLSQSLDGNGVKVEEFRGRLTEVASRDLERQSAITSIRRGLDSVVDPRPDLQAMRSTLGAVQRDLGTVLEAAAQLSVNGAVVDLGGLQSRVVDLEALRERFRTANGELLDAAAVELRLAEVEQRAVTADALSAALGSHVFELSADQTASLEERISVGVLAQAGRALDSFRIENDARVGSRLDGIGGLVDSRVADALPGLESSLASTLGARIDTAEQSAVATAGGIAQASIESSAAGLRNDLEAQIQSLDAGIATQVQTEVSRRVATELTVLRSSLDSTGARIDSLGGRVAKLDELQRSHATQLATLPQDLASLRNELQKALLAEVDLQVATVERTINQRIEGLARDNDLKLRSLSRELSSLAVDEARRTATDTAQASTSGLRAELLGEMRTIAREEQAATLNESVRVAVDRSVSTQLAGVPNLVRDEVRRQRLVTRDGTLNPVIDATVDSRVDTRVDSRLGGTTVDTGRAPR